VYLDFYTAKGIEDVRKDVSAGLAGKTREFEGKVKRIGWLVSEGAMEVHTVVPWAGKGGVEEIGVDAVSNFY
jgi:hypothetical protein